jgi:hypothetical protein
MIRTVDDDGHVQIALGLYVLGALPVAERPVIEEHLRWCGACQAEWAELSEVPAALAMLTDDDVQTLIADFGGPVGSSPVDDPDSATGVPLHNQHGSGPATER